MPQFFVFLISVSTTICSVRFKNNMIIYNIYMTYEYIYYFIAQKMIRFGLLLIGIALSLDVTYTMKVNKSKRNKMTLGCAMRKHGSGEEIGEVRFTVEKVRFTVEKKGERNKRTTNYIASAKLKADELTLKYGAHGLHVHSYGVNENTRYSEWFRVPPTPSARDYVPEIVEDRKFQIKTNKPIKTPHDIRWMMGGVGWFTFTTGSLNAGLCNQGYPLTGEEGFLKEDGVLTFLKTATHLKVWFNDVPKPVVDWKFDDNQGTRCRMRNKLNGLNFDGNAASQWDRVTVTYRYEVDPGNV